MFNELKRLRSSHSKLKEIISRFERLAKYKESPDKAFEDLEVQRQIVENLTEDLAKKKNELRAENEDLGIQIEEILERNEELIKAERELNRAKIQAELYVDLMGHDINNMNMMSMGYLELALDTLDSQGHLDKDNRNLIAKPYELLEDASRLISNVRKVQRENAGFYKLEVMDIDRVLKEVKDLYLNLPDQAVNIKYTSGDRCRVMANELLKDVFSNLVGNAIKHSQKTVTIEIKSMSISENGKDYCKVTVEDNGPGIPDDMKCTLFDRLTLDGAREKGKGFGLCLIKLLVDDYRGKFWVENRVPEDYSKGAKFVILLPTIEH